MIKVTVIALAGIKEKYFREASDEYLKRLKGYCDLKIVEIPPVKLPEKPSKPLILSALEKEADEILKKIPSGDYVTALCIEGKQFSSEEFASVIKNNTDMGIGLTFIIGSSFGLSDRVKSVANAKMSFSKMTFPHRLFRIMLLEQIYRGFSINAGTPYHK